MCVAVPVNVFGDAAVEPPLRVIVVAVRELSPVRLMVPSSMVEAETVPPSAVVPAV